MILCFGNLLMTSFLFSRKVYLENYLMSGIIKFLIALGFYINLLSAFFYLFLFLDKSWIHSGFFDNPITDKLWLEFHDILKFKVPATLHAITYKLYADFLREKVKEHMNSIMK